MSYVIYRDFPGVRTAQRAERAGGLFWPTVRMGTLGQVRRPGPPRYRQEKSPTRGLGVLRRNATPCGTCGLSFGEQPAPPRSDLGSLAAGSVVVLPAGSILKDVNGVEFSLNAPVRFSTLKSVDVEIVGVGAPSAGWTPAQGSVACKKDVQVVALDPVSATPVVSGGEFAANPGFKAIVPKGVLFAVETAAEGSTLASAPVSNRASSSRVGMIIAVASAIVVVGLFAATLSLGKPKLRAAEEV